jgi:ribosomal protein S18 acetylase RimI-like enzyme
MDTLALRPATSADIEFCFDLHKSSFYQYVTEIWGWDEKDQRAIHSRDFKVGRVQIVTANGVDVGRLDVDYGDEEIFLLLIELLPNHRGQGLGSRLIRTVLDRAAAEGKPLVLNVLEVNRRAYELYRRLGFTEDRRFVEGPAVKIRMVAGQPE